MIYIYFRGKEYIIDIISFFDLFLQFNLYKYLLKYKK